ncbi:Ig-like domain-containing protein [Myxococcus sp. Y35]|uniref:Ig-like domain-containing protein n=1 Tax=Pseudomyxococcus flavus TaxID=3115648 RepID=UPI003CF26871
MPDDSPCAAGCGSGTVCDETADNGRGACVQCLSDAQCGGDTPVCDLTSKSCKTCLAGTDDSTQGCLPGQVCNADGNGGLGVCEGCSTNAECAEGTPQCKSGSPGVCVECLENSHCASGAQPVCSDNNVCGCAENAQCGGETPLCDAARDNGQGECVECIDNSQCTAQQSCNAAGRCEALTGLDEASAQIAAFHAAPTGDQAEPLAIHGAFVTAITPTTAEPRGFFVQAQAQGPALFVSHSDEVQVAVGDRVSFKVVTKILQSGNAAADYKLGTASVISDFQKLSSGHPVRKPAEDGGLVTHVTDDVVVNIDTYESRLVRVTGKVTTTAGTGRQAGTGYKAAQFAIDGTTLTGGMGPRLRMPTELADLVGVGLNCLVSVQAGVMWRYDDAANTPNPQTPYYPMPLVTAFSLSDFSVDCSETAVTLKVQTVVPLSPTQLRVTFEPGIDPSTITDVATQFTFGDSGLAASAYTLDEKTLVLTTTAQEPGTQYTLTVDPSVKSYTGVSVSGTATFKGYRVPALLVINEVNPNITTGVSATNNRDLIELKAVTGGAIEGITLTEEASSVSRLATLPDVTVAAGDLIVIHFRPNSAELAAGNDMLAKDEKTYETFYPGAWDVVTGTSSHPTFNDRLLRIANPQGETQDVVAFSHKSMTTTRPAAYPVVLQAAQAEGHWSPVDCRGETATPVACTYDSAPLTALDVSVDWGVVDANTKSVFRYSGADTHSVADWAAAETSSFGEENPARP